MSVSKIKAIMHVAPTALGMFGIRIRLTRNAPGVWMGSGAKEETLPPGAKWINKPCEWYWVWETSEAAEGYLRDVAQENDAGFGAEK